MGQPDIVLSSPLLSFTHLTTATTHTHLQCFERRLVYDDFDYRIRFALTWTHGTVERLYGHGSDALGSETIIDVVHTRQGSNGVCKAFQSTVIKMADSIFPADCSLSLLTHRVGTRLCTSPPKLSSGGSSWPNPSIHSALRCSFRPKEDLATKYL